MSEKLVSFFARQLQAHVERLESSVSYASTFRDFQAFEVDSGRPGLPFVVWRLGLSAPSASDIAAGAFGEWPVDVIWREFRGADGSLSVKQTSIKTIFLDWPALLEEAAVHSFDVGRMQQALTAAGTPWPDVIITDRLFSDCFRSTPSADLIVNALNFLYHFTEAGGLLISAERSGAPCTFAVNSFFSANGVRPDDVSASAVAWVLYKEPNIYTAKTGPANRSSIFLESTCRRAMEQTLERLPLGTAPEVLDVGVGDGRFSRYIVDGCSARRWRYTGLEIAKHKEMKPRPEWDDLARMVHYDANFLAWNERKYDVVFLLFVLHTFHRWPLYIYQAWRLLRPGGFLLIGTRDDRFTQWIHGEIKIRTSCAPENALESTCRSYWRARWERGVRNFDHIRNALTAAPVWAYACRLGFAEESPVRVRGERTYHFERDHICPADAHAVWNVGRVGVTVQDREALRNFLSPDPIEVRMEEHMNVAIYRKL